MDNLVFEESITTETDQSEFTEKNGCMSTTTTHRIIHRK